MCSATARDIPVAGQWRGGLGNAGEMLTLMVGQQVAQQFRYDDRWYDDTDGDGASLEFIRARDAALEQWSQAMNWRPSVPDGTPGQARIDVPGDANRDGEFDSTDMIAVLQLGEYEDNVAGNSAWEDGD